MTIKRITFPFPAIVGQELMKLGLILNVINPTLSGVLIRGEKGTGKSTAVRALARILPEIEVIEGCPFQCAPENKEKICPTCRFNLSCNPERTIKRKVKVAELPISATEDRVIGTVDIEHALKKGEKKIEPGILAAAHRGILYVDEVNLLDDHIVDVLLDSAAMGVNTIEREGVSFSHPARFVLVGTMNPEEGEIRPQLLDRFGLCVNIQSLNKADERMEIVKRREEFEASPQKFIETWQAESQKLVERINKAKEIYPKVSIDDTILRKIVDLVIDLNIDGHRGEIMMMKVAKTFASFEGRTQVESRDIEVAAEMCLSHRVRRKPFEEVGLDVEKIKKHIRKDIQGGA